MDPSEAASENDFVIFIAVRGSCGVNVLQARSKRKPFMVQSCVKSFTRQARTLKRVRGVSPFQTTTTMPPRRQFGAEISGNRRRGPSLTPDQRLQIIAKASAGVSTTELVKEFNRDATTIRRVIRLATTRTTTTEAPRSGRPPILSRY